MPSHARASAIIGAGTGFLWYNAYPADVFMGDTGSFGLGGALAPFVFACLTVASWYLRPASRRLAPAAPLAAAR